MTTRDAHSDWIFDRFPFVCLLGWLFACLLGGALPQARAQNSAADALYKRTISAYTAGKLEEALKLAGEAIAIEKNDPKLFLARGYIYQYERKYQQAVDDFSRAIELNPNSVDALQRRGEEQFKLANFKESVADFERVVALQPQRRPYHWQLGISYYYTGQFKEGIELFESHQTVNSSDVENAVWHFLCVAKGVGLEAAKKRLLPIPNDTRVPMMQIYALFGDKGTAVSYTHLTLPTTPYV